MNNASTIYAWEGINRKGRRVSGQTKAHNPALVKAQLRQQGISPGRVRKHSPMLPSPTHSVKATDITLFTRQLATLLRAGIPLLQAFDIINEGFDLMARGESIRSVVIWPSSSQPNPAAITGVRVNTAAVGTAAAVCKPQNINTK